ncbi:MAG: hypothetical protein GF388_02800 [Candidatus Aegiribacteria sp.]|nr:hypothetical protein [Candidatus Aegiribacteria sp.]MBD3294220.1 hypothetical protein [Candidatus Fermentibacteria bacterium]
MKVIPRAPVTAFKERMADGTLKISLSAPPTDGKANRELISFLSKQFGTGRRNVRIITGETSRKKLVSIETWTRTPNWFS